MDDLYVKCHLLQPEYWLQSSHVGNGLLLPNWFFVPQTVAILRHLSNSFAVELRKKCWFLEILLRGNEKEINVHRIQHLAMLITASMHWSLLWARAAHLTGIFPFNIHRNPTKGWLLSPRIICPHLLRKKGSEDLSLIPESIYLITLYCLLELDTMSI